MIGKQIRGPSKLFAITETFPTLREHFIDFEKPWLAMTRDRSWGLVLVEGGSVVLRYLNSLNPLDLDEDSFFQSPPVSPKTLDRLINLHGLCGTCSLLIVAGGK